MKLAVALSCAALAACSQGVTPHDSGVRDAQAVEPQDDASAPPDAAPAIDAAEVPLDAAADEVDAGVPADSGTEVAPDAETFGPYAEDGTETFSTFSVEVSSGARSFTEHVHLPDSATPHAVVLFAPGTQQPASSYEPYQRRLASHGIIVLTRDDPGPLTRTQEVVEDLVYLATEWLPAQNADSASAFFGRVDATRVGVAGHSRGGKATLLAAEGALKGLVRAYFGVDTVDVTFIDDGVYAITDVASVGIPTAFLVAEVPSNCSPANANGEVLYRSAPSPSVLLVALGAGHTDFADPCVLCGVCTPDGMIEPSVVLDFSVRYVTAFFARELLGDASVGPAFEGAGAGLDTAAGLIRVEAK